MSSRIEKIRKCRSVNDITGIVAAIATDTKQIKETIRAMAATITRSGRTKMQVSLSALTRKPIKDQTIVLERDQKGNTNLTKKQSTDGTARGIKDFVAPKKDLIAKHSAVYQKLHDNVSDLNSAEKHLLSTITDVPAKRTALQAIRALKSDLESQIDKAFSILTNVGEKHLPPELRADFEAMTKYVLRNLDRSTYSKTSKYIVVVPAPTLKNVETQLADVNKELNDSRKAMQSTMAIVDKKKADYQRLLKKLPSLSIVKNKKKLQAVVKKTKSDVKQLQEISRIEAIHTEPENAAARDAIKVAQEDYLKAVQDNNIARSRRDTFAFDEFQFCCYLEFTDLKSTTGWVCEDFYLVMSGVVNARNILRVYIDALPNFVAPGHYEINYKWPIENKAGIQHRINALMAANDIAPDFERYPMPYDADNKNDIKKFMLPGVVSVDVVDDKLVLYITKGAEGTGINKIVSAVAPLLRNDHLKKTGGRTINVPWKRGKRNSKGLLGVEFSLIGAARIAGEMKKQFVMDAAALKELQHILPMTDEQMVRIKRALVRGV